MKLSIIVPVYNEENTLEEILRRVERLEMKGVVKEIIVVNDGSSDKTPQILSKIEAKNKNIKILSRQEVKNLNECQSRKRGVVCRLHNRSAASSDGSADFTSYHRVGKIPLNNKLHEKMRISK